LNLTHACLEFDHSYDAKGQRFANNLPPDRFAKEYFTLRVPVESSEATLQVGFLPSRTSEHSCKRGNENVDVDNDHIEEGDVKALNDDFLIKVDNVGVDNELTMLMLTAN